jgi:lactoylglutathione lyase
VTPKLTRVRLLVSDVQACFHLYRDVQGFEVLWADEEGNYVSFKTGDVLLTLNRQDSMTAAVGTTDKPPSAACQDKVALIMAVEDVDVIYQQLQARGVAFITEPIDHTNWGLRTAHFRDPDGNLIEINSSLSMEAG